MAKGNLRERIIAAAEALLEREGAVGPLELLQQIGFLQSVHVEQWRRGNPYYSNLESHIQCGEKKLAVTWQHFLEWVREKRLKPIEASYIKGGRSGAERLQVTIDDDPQREAFFRVHYCQPDLSPTKAKRLEKKLSKAPDLTVFQLTSDRSQCGECGLELLRGDLLYLENEQALCLTCADMDHLEFLPSGDTALTRRARAHSPLVAIVVRFNRSRNRYERQGILATPEAIARAEAECAGDADERAARRKVDAARRAEQDKQLIAEMTAALLADYPACPPAEAAAIAAHTATRGSGRVGRSAAGRSLAAEALRLAVRAWIRHQHTGYDGLLMQGLGREVAREIIAGDVQRVAELWASRPETR